MEDSHEVSMPHAALWVVQLEAQLRSIQITLEFQCRTRLCGWCSVGERRTRTIHRHCFNAARGFVGGAAPLETATKAVTFMFQCRTRLCGWCSALAREILTGEVVGFNAARGFVGGAAREDFQNGTLSLCFNAARGFVGGAAKKNDMLVERILCFNAARGFVGGAACHPRCILSFRRGFNAARGFVGGAASKIGFFPAAFCVSMPHAALWVVQPRRSQLFSP